MAECSSAFASAIAYSLDKLGIPDIALKEEQQEAVKAIYEGKDVFVLLPTSFGKSLCYQVLPFVMDYKYSCTSTQKTSSSVLANSPPIALMIDQVESLGSRGVKCSIATSKGVKKEFLFCAPEALVTSRWRDILEEPVISERVVAVVIDEAHCVSK